MILEVAMLQAIEVRGPRRYAALDGAWASGYSAGLSKAPRSLVVPGEVPQDPGISRAIPGYPGGAATFQFLHVEAANWSHHVITMMACTECWSREFPTQSQPISGNSRTVQWIHWTHRDPREAGVPQNGPLMAVVKTCFHMFPQFPPTSTSRALPDLCLRAQRQPLPSRGAI